MAVKRYVCKAILVAVFLIGALGSVDVTLSTDHCDGEVETYRDDDGRISTGHPGIYPGECNWRGTIESASGLPLWIVLREVDIGLGDYFVIYDDEGRKYDYVFPDEKPESSIEFGYYLRYNFTSDDFAQDRGFIIEWSTMQPDDEIIQIEDTFGGEIIERDVFTDVAVYLQSPNYPDSYDPNSLIHWILTAPTDERIVFLFKYFKMDASGDSLVIYSGADLDSEELIGEYEGNLNLNLPPPLISPYNRARVVFTTNNLIQHQGFSIQYSVYRETTPAPIKTTTQSNKLAPGMIAVVVIAVIVVVLIIFIILVYICWYRPLKAQLAAEQAAALCEEQEDDGFEMEEDEERPKSSQRSSSRTAAHHATARPGHAVQLGPRSRTMISRQGTTLHHSMALRNSSPSGHSRLGGLDESGRSPSLENGRPGTSQSRPGSSNSGPGTSSSRPGTSYGRPGTSSHRPGTSSGRTELNGLATTQKDYRSTENSESILKRDWRESTTRMASYPLVFSAMGFSGLGGNRTDVGKPVEVKPPLSSLVGTRSKTILEEIPSRVKGYDQVFVNDGDTDDGDDVLYKRTGSGDGLQTIYEGESAPKKLPPIATLPTIAGAALPPIQQPSRSYSSTQLINRTSSATPL